MRIAVLNSIRAYGGGEKWVLRASHGLRERGEEVTLFPVPGSELERRGREANLGVVPTRYPHDLSPSGVLGLYRGLRALKPEVVVACNERAVRLGSIALRLPGLRQVPLVYRNGLEGSFKNKAYNRRVAGPRIARYAVNAEALREEYRRFGWVPMERVRVIYNGVDPVPVEQADPSGVREELGAAPDEVVVLAAARLVPEKGHEFLLRALAAVRPERRPVLWIAGDGPEERVLEATITGLELDHRAHLLGFRADVPRLLRAADLLCHPSRREGAPNIVLEAMAAGLPVVAVDASGTAELVRDGETGLLSPPDDVIRLRDNLERVAADPELRRRLGAAGSERARHEFSEERSLDRWQQLLRECVEEAAR